MSRPSTWTDDERQKLKELWLIGLSATELSKALRLHGIHKSRNAVIGQCYRDGLSKNALTEEDRQLLVEKRKQLAQDRGTGNRQTEKKNKKIGPVRYNLIEPWAEYSARKKKEREALKAKGAFRIYQSARRTLGK